MLLAFLSRVALLWRVALLLCVVRWSGQSSSNPRTKQNTKQCNAKPSKSYNVCRGRKPQEQRGKKPGHGVLGVIGFRGGDGGVPEMVARISAEDDGEDAQGRLVVLMSDVREDVKEEREALGGGPVEA